MQCKNDVLQHSGGKGEHFYIFGEFSAFADNLSQCTLSLFEKTFSRLVQRAICATFFFDGFRLTFASGYRPGLPLTFQV